MMKLINELGKLGNCFDLCSTISHYVTNRREFKEVEETIFLTRSILSNFMKKSPPDYEFNLFISEIETSLDRLCTLYSNKENKDAKIEIFEVDYLLKQQMEQLNFEYINCSDISPIALIEDIFAKKFWLENFGKERLVEKNKFIEELYKALDANLSDKEAEQLEYYLDFTEDGYISVFEFQKLLLNFGPFRKLASNLKELSQHNLAIFKISSKRANNLLEKKKAGDYLLRFSKSQSNSFAITYIDQKNTVKNSLIINTRDGIKTTSSNTVYSSLPKFLSVHNCILKSCESLTISLIRSLTLKINVPFEDNLPGLVSRVSSPSYSYSPSCLSSNQEEDDKDAQISNICVSCLKSQRDSVMDCKHFVCCFSCSSSLKACPVCHAPNNNPIQIYVC